MWSDSARSVWGKLDRESDKWLPLVTHLMDAHAVAGILWDRFLADAVKATICTSAGLTDREGRALASWLAGVHDVGKASPAFAFKAEAAGFPSVLDRMRDAGLRCQHADTSIGHATIGQAALHEWLVAVCGSPPRKAKTWAGIVGGHHGRNPSNLELESARGHRAFGDEPWARVRAEILTTMAAHGGDSPNLPLWTQRALPIPAQTLLTAIVVMADWIASNQDYFPYMDGPVTGERAETAYGWLGLPGPWRPAIPTDVRALFHTRFPMLTDAEPRGTQLALVEAALGSQSPPLLIVEEAMGQGKTEAAFLAAEALCARFGQGGVFFGLPTMATANPMFSRTLDWLETALGDADASVALAHGKAGLNDRYSGLLQHGTYGHVYDDDGDGARGQAVANAWLRGRRKAGLSSFVVGTIDQALFLGLKAKHVALRHLGMAGKVVVIDEVHAADTYMREYLKRVLSWLSAIGTPVILMSATLPPDQRDEYVAAYAAGRGVRGPQATDRTDRYPRITRYDGTLCDAPVSPSTGGTPVVLERMADDADALSALLETRLAEGGCAGVICNTVLRAQETFHVLKARFGDDVVLLHSRFLAPHRAEKEQGLVRVLGRDGRRPDRLIVVGTQVLEQSLDIDFDVMITDLAPVDLLLQRVGRLHRHAGRSRPSSMAHAELHIRGADWEAEPPLPVIGSRAIYGEAPLLRAAAVLRGRSGLALPFEIAALVSEAYEPGLAAPQGWEARWAEAEDRAAKARTSARDRAKTYLLDEPNILSDLTGWLDVAAEDPERSEERGHSQVRDSEDSLEVIALWRDPDKQLRLPSYPRSHAGAPVPEGVAWGTTGQELSVARAMADCTLPLPVNLTHDRVIDRVINELEQRVDASGWQKSPWVTGQLVLVFDDEGKTTLAGFNLRYHPDEGLLVTEPVDGE